MLSRTDSIGAFDDHGNIVMRPEIAWASLLVSLFFFFLPKINVSLLSGNQHGPKKTEREYDSLTLSRLLMHDTQK